MVEVFVAEQSFLVGELLAAVELEHQSLVKRLESWVIRVPKLRPLGVKVYVVPPLGR